jgi:hypothetical protein
MNVIIVDAKNYYSLKYTIMKTSHIFYLSLLALVFVIGCELLEPHVELSEEFNQNLPSLSEELGFGSLLGSGTSENADLVIDIVSKKPIKYHVNDKSYEELVEWYNALEDVESILVNATARHAEGDEQWEGVTISFNESDIGRRTDENDHYFYLRDVMTDGNYNPADDVTINVSKPGFDWSTIIPSNSIIGGNLNANPIASFYVEDMNHGKYFRKDKSLYINWIDVFPNYSDDTYFILCTHDKPCYSKVIPNGTEQTLIPSSDFSFLDVGDLVTMYLVRMNEDCFTTQDNKMICIRQAMLTRAFNKEVIDGPI